MDKITNIQELNRAIERLESYQKMADTQQSTFIDEINALEQNIKAYKFLRDINQTCSVCGVHKTRSGEILNHVELPMSPEKLHVRVCSKAKKEGCINTCNSAKITKAEYKQLDYQDFSKKDLDKLIGEKSESLNIDEGRINIAKSFNIDFKS